MDEKDIEIKVTEDRLTIKGEKQEEKDEKEEDYLRRYGSFERSLGLPDSVYADKIEANFKKGILTVTLPKKAAAQKAAKKIEVKSS